MTAAILVMVLNRQKISLNQRSILQNSISAPQSGGIVRMAKFIALGTMVIELIGAFSVFYFHMEVWLGKGALLCGFPLCLGFL